MNLPKPFDTFRLEKKAGEYKDFHVTQDNLYPLKGVTYPTNYGDIQGYTAEDGYPLDVFIGTGDVLGFFQVFRPEIAAGQVEHKIYVNVTGDEEAKIFKEFGPVLRAHARLNTMDDLLQYMERFRDED